jgi:hypothetical protein
VQLRFDRGMVVSAAPAGERAEQALAEMLVRCGLLTGEQAEALSAEAEAAAQTVPRLAVARGWISREQLERIEDLLTRETFFDVLRWRRGAFDFRPVSVEHSRSVPSLLGAEQILMDGLRMLDEWQSFAERAPSEDAVFQRSAGFEEYRKRSRLDPAQLEAAERVYRLVDGRSQLRRIVDLSLLGTFDATRLLVDLRDNEVIEPIAEEALHRLRARSAARGGRRAGLLRDLAGWLAGLACLALLAGVGVFARLHAAPAAPSAPGQALRADPGAALWAAWQDRRVRHALEAYRFLGGRWPQGLDELAARGLLAPNALAGAQSRPYYYSAGDEGVLLLAPER